MKKLLAVILLLAIALTLVSCASEKETAETEAPTAETQPKDETGVDVNVYVLTGPTGIGAVNMWDYAEKGELSQNYHFTALAAPDEIVSKISTGDADIAVIATNLAAKLYKKTGGKIQLLAVNTLGVLSVLDNTGAEIKSLADLKGRKIVTTGQGANPEYIINYLLTKNGLDVEKYVTIEYKVDGTELVSVWAQGGDEIIIAPQPVASAIAMKYENAKTVLDLTEEWNKVSTDSELMMGCVVVGTDFAKAHPTVVSQFLADYANSIKQATEDITATASLCEKYSITASAKIAEKAIPYCGLTYIEAQDARNALEGYFRVLLDADPTSIGGEIPDDGFWYAK